MEKEIYDERNGLYYTLCGDYYLPNLVLPEERTYRIGKYGQMRRRFLKEHQPGIYEALVLSGKLHEHLEETERACRERMERLISEMACREGITERLKAADQMKWVGLMNNLRSAADELVQKELIYV